MKVVNLSLGANAIDSYTNDPLCKAVRKLVDAGIVVVAAAGNEGKDGAGAIKFTVKFIRPAMSRRRSRSARLTLTEPMFVRMM